MKPILIAVIIILAGIVVYLFLTRKPPDLIVGPSQKELNEFKALQARKEDSLKTAINTLKNEKYTDSLKRVQNNSLSTKVIKTLKDSINSMLEGLSDSLPKIVTIEKQAAVIELQGQVIRKQDERIMSDSLFISGLQINFDKRLAAEVEQRKLLEEKLAMSDRVIGGKDAEIKRRKTSGVVKSGIIAGLLALIVFL